MGFTPIGGGGGGPGSPGPPGPAGPEGPEGPSGAPGTPGQAATISVGNTTTVPPGTPANVTNTGTAQAAIFDFDIPQGEPGVSTTHFIGLIDGSTGDCTYTAASGFTNGPLIAADTVPPGTWLLCSVAGTIPEGAIEVGDWLISDGTNWNIVNMPAGAYLPLTGGTLSGPLSVNPTAGAATAGQLTVGGQGINYAPLGAIGANIAFAYQAPNFFAYVNGTAVGPFVTGGPYVLRSGDTMTGTLNITMAPNVPPVDGLTITSPTTASMSLNGTSAAAVNLSGATASVNLSGDNASFLRVGSVVTLAPYDWLFGMYAFPGAQPGDVGIQAVNAQGNDVFTPVPFRIAQSDGSANFRNVNGGRFTTNAGDPLDPNQLTRKQYVDNAIAAIPLPDLSEYLPLTGGTLTGPLVIGEATPEGEITGPGLVVDAQGGIQILNHISNAVRLVLTGTDGRISFVSDTDIVDIRVSGGARPGLSIANSTVEAVFIDRNGALHLSQDLDMGLNRVTFVEDPTEDTDAATKAYVDEAIDGILPPDFSGYLPLTGGVLTGPLLMQRDGEVSALTLETNADGAWLTINGRLASFVEFSTPTERLWDIGWGDLSVPRAFFIRDIGAASIFPFWIEKDTNITHVVRVVTIVDPTTNDELTRKGYVDAQIAAAGAAFVQKAGDTMTGDLTIQPATTGQAGVLTLSAAPNTTTAPPGIEFNVPASGASFVMEYNTVGGPDDVGLRIRGGANAAVAAVLIPVVTGRIQTLMGDPVEENDLSRKAYVDTAITTLKNYVDEAVVSGARLEGIYQVATNTPDLTAVTPAAGNYWFAVTQDPATPDAITITLPGIPSGTLIGEGDALYYEGTEWGLIRAGGLTKPTADLFYLQKSGDTLTGPLVLAGNATANLNPVSLQQMNAAIAPLATTASLASYLLLAGGTMTGLLTLSGAPTANLHAATKQYVDTAVAAIPQPDLSAYVLKAGDTMSGLLTMQRTGTDGELVRLNRAETGQYPHISWRHGGTARWNLEGTNGNEYDLQLARYNDAGGYQDHPIVFSRATGHATLSQQPTAPNHAATKAYVDSLIGNSGWQSLTLATGWSGQPALRVRTINGGTSIQMAGHASRTGGNVGTAEYTQFGTLPAGMRPSQYVRWVIAGDNGRIFNAETDATGVITINPSGGLLQTGQWVSLSGVLPLGSVNAAGTRDVERTVH